MIDLRCGDCRDLLKTIPDASVDAVITDPPYPEIDRPYGRMTEAQWHEMMRSVIAECRRILKPRGSAVFILQPNSERVGRMRPWLWEFMAWTAREWNQVQDAWWWNIAAAPTVHCQRKYGLMRPSLKAAVWLGDPDCYRDQGEVLWDQGRVSQVSNLEDRSLKRSPSGQSFRNQRAYAACRERGGVTPFNVLPWAATGGNTSENPGHSAATPPNVMDWWTCYLVPPGGTACDPFMGSGTEGLVCVKRNLNFIGFEQMPVYHAIAQSRISAAQSPALPA